VLAVEHGIEIAEHLSHPASPNQDWRFGATELETEAVRHLKSDQVGNKGRPVGKVNVLIEELRQDQREIWIAAPGALDQLSRPRE
jgi:hypothetical protein